MCLPSAAPPGSPVCYPVRNYSKSRKRNVSLQEKEQYKSTDYTHENNSPLKNKQVIPDTVNSQTRQDNNFKARQACERREKSRIAAKQRRHRENQALVELYLALPIQQNLAADVLRNKCQKMTHSELEDHEQISESLSRGGSLSVNNELSFAPTYRLAATIFRQHNLSTPVLEKAVIVRIASNALCIYNWLHPLFESDVNVKLQRKLPLLDYQSAESDSSLSSIELSHFYTSVGDGDIILPTAPPNFNSTITGTSTTTTTTNNNNNTITKTTLSVHSKSLMAIIVDTTENTIVYSPPAYTDLIGLSWVTTIGLKLSELVARQTSIGVSSELRTHQHHHSRVLQDNKHTIIDEITNCKQKSAIDHYDFECALADQAVSSSYSSKSFQNNRYAQQLECISSDMIWPSSTGVTDRPMLLNSILPTTVNPLSHAEYLDYSNSETETGSTHHFQDPNANFTTTATTTTTNSATIKRTMDQYAICWNSSMTCFNESLPLSNDATTDVTSSSSVLSVPFIPSQGNYKPADRIPSSSIKASTNCATSLSISGIDNFHNNTKITHNNGSDIEFPPYRNQVKKDLNLRIYLLQPMCLNKGNGNTGDYLNKDNHGVCTINSNNTNHNNYNTTCRSKTKGSYDFLKDSSSTELNNNNGVYEYKTNMKFVDQPTCYTGLSASFKTYHSMSNLKFMDMDHNFLALSGYTDVSLLNISLFDIVHVDDLAHISEAINMVNENQPVITSFYRIRMKCGQYCWVRTLISCLTQPRCHQSKSLVSTTTGHYGHRTVSDKNLNTCSKCYQSCDGYCLNTSINNASSYSAFGGVENSSMNSANSISGSSMNSVCVEHPNSFNLNNNYNSLDTLVCYHQFAHLYQHSDLCESFSSTQELLSNYDLIKQQPVSNLNKYEQLDVYNLKSEPVFTSHLLGNQDSNVRTSNARNYNKSNFHQDTSNFNSKSNSYATSLLQDPLSTFPTQDEMYTNKKDQMENVYDCVSYPGYSGSSSSESSLFDALTSPPSPLNESNKHHNNCYHNNQKQQLFTQEEIPLAMKIIGMSNVSSDQEIIDSSTIPSKNELDGYSLDPPLNHSAAASSSAVISTAPVSLHKPSAYLNDIYSNKSNSTNSRRAITPATNTTVNDNMNCMTSHPMGLSSVKNQVSLYKVGIEFKEIRQVSTSFLLCVFFILHYSVISVRRLCS
ncbi:unnamed protein product [Trichobilharzia szidati]|nr:unnamed protein product [Trichobilharzia szidati]